MIDLPERIREVSITSFGTLAGKLQQPAQYSFAYDPRASHPCSLTMPIRTQSYHYGSLHPVFAQNLPEGYVRKYISQRLERHAEVNDMYLLALQQSHGIGHLCVQSPIVSRDYEQLKLTDILQWQGTQPLFAELLERYYLRGMLSGVQPKVLVPVQGRPTIAQRDLIVKTFDDEFELLTVNEYVCMSAAQACGLNPPNFWLSDDQRSFVIERFDRKDEHPLGFEDFTVLTGKSKYSGSYETLLRAVDDYTKSPEQVARAYQLIVFNCLIGNGDAHLKNFALQYEAGGSPTLTPPYDLTHTLIYPTLDRNMALKMDGAKRFPDRKALTKLGLSAGIRNPDEVIESLADTLTNFISSCDLIELIPGFRQSLEQSLAVGARREHLGIRRDRITKH